MLPGNRTLVYGYPLRQFLRQFLLCPTDRFWHRLVIVSFFRPGCRDAE